MTEPVIALRQLGPLSIGTRSHPFPRATGLLAAMPDAGADYLFVVPVAVIALAGGVLLTILRLRAGVTETVPPRIEHADHSPAGDALEESIMSLPWLRSTDAHASIRRELRELALTSLVYQRGCTRRGADEELRSGDWTEDPLVREFLASPQFTPPPVRTRIRERVLGRHWYRRRLLASIAALESVTEPTDE